MLHLLREAELELLWIHFFSSLKTKLDPRGHCVIWASYNVQRTWQYMELAFPWKHFSFVWKRVGEHLICSTQCYEDIKVYKTQCLSSRRPVTSCRRKCPLLGWARNELWFKKWWGWGSFNTFVDVFQRWLYWPVSVNCQLTSNNFGHM